MGFEFTHSSADEDSHLQGCYTMSTGMYSTMFWRSMLPPSPGWWLFTNQHGITFQNLSKVHPRTGHEGPEEEQRYSSTLPSTSVLYGGGWSVARLSRALPPEETWYPFYRRLVGPQGWSGWAQKISPLPGFDPRTAQPIASCCTITFQKTCVIFM